jgi:O-antigen/teichoic acid export membrane protein
VEVSTSSTLERGAAAPRPTPAPTATLADRAARGTGVTLAGQAARVVLQFGSMVILARLLTPEDFGRVAMVAAIIGISDMVREFGLSSAAIQAKFITQDERTNLFWTNTGLGLGSAVVMSLLAPLIAAFYGQPTLLWLVVAMSLSFVFSGVTTQFRADLTRELRFGALVAVDLAGFGAGLALGAVAAFGGFGSWAIVLQQVSAIAITCVLSALVSRWRPGLPKRHVSIRRFLRFGAGLLGTQAIGYAVKNVDSIAIGAVWGALPLGLYDRSYQLMMTPLSQVNAPMTRIALPVLSRVSDDRQAFARYLQKAQLVGAYGTASIFAVATGLATPIVLVLFGEKWLGVAGIFAALAVGGLFRAISQIPYWIFLATGNTGAQLRIFAWMGPLMIAVILAGLPWGPLGVAIGSSVAYFIHWLVPLLRVRAVTGVESGPLIRNAWRIVLTVSVPSGLVAWLATLLPVPPIAQVAAGLAFAFAYLALMTLAVPSVRRDVAVGMSFARRMAGGRVRVRPERRAGRTSAGVSALSR